MFCRMGCSLWMAVLPLLCFSLMSCTSSHSAKQAGGRDTAVLSRPTVPIHIFEPEEQARYLVEHYWEDVDLSHPLGEDEELNLEVRLADYVGLVQSLPPQEQAHHLLVPLSKSGEATLISLLTMYRRLLYEAGSPLVSDECYAPILEWCVATPKLSQEFQLQAQSLLERVRLNCEGSPASDFIYTQLDGSRHRLLYEKAPHTLLVFATANCSVCHDALRSIAQSRTIQDDVRAGNLGVLVVYVQTAREEYEEEQASLPEWVRSGYDATGEILDKPIYDIKASPTIYIISRSGKVVAKDLAPERLPSLSAKSIMNHD